MRLARLSLGVIAFPAVLPAQAQSRFPPDSLVNTQVITRTTPVIQVIGMMRNVANDLGVRCQFCHVGEGGPAARALRLRQR